MVNMLTQQIGTVFNHLIQNTNQSYQVLATQMGKITNFFSPIQPGQQQIPQVQNPQALQIVERVVQRQQPVPQSQPVEPVVQAQPEVILVNRNNDGDEIVRNVEHPNLGAHNNIANLIEAIMAQNGLNIGLHRTNFVSALSEYVLQTELPRGLKIPKFIKFAGDTSESTVEHIAYYLTEVGDIANNEKLKKKNSKFSNKKSIYMVHHTCTTFSTTLESVRKIVP